MFLGIRHGVPLCSDPCIGAALLLPRLGVTRDQTAMVPQLTCMVLCVPLCSCRPWAMGKACY